MKTACTVLLVVSGAIVPILFVSGCSDKPELEGDAWFRCAEKYDRVMTDMWASGGTVKAYNTVLQIKQQYLQTSQPSEIELLSMLLQIEQQYLQTSQPSETELVSMLRSPNRHSQRVALVALSIEPIETDQIVDALFEFLQDRDPAFRWYALESLAKFSTFSEITRANLGEKLLQIVKARKDEDLSPREFTLLAKFPSEKTARFLTEQLMKEGEETRISILRHVAFRALKEMGASYYENAVKDVHKNGGPGIRRDILMWEKFLEERGK
jgi:hypothetical protein